MRWRDLTVFDLPHGDRLVIACDAAGGIGPKLLDQIQVSGYLLGRFTARVPLMELLAVGARPIQLVNTTCVEPEPTGHEILRGVRDEAALAGLSLEQINGSFEKNIATIQTGLGITALGWLEGDQPLRRGRSGDLVIAIGRPKVGAEVTLADPELPDLALVAHLSSQAPVHDLLPVGSRGIRAEVVDLAQSAGLEVEWLPPEEGWELTKSAGPSTCLLAAVEPAALVGLALSLKQPWAPVAQLR